MAISLVAIAALAFTAGADPFDDSCTAPTNPITPPTPTTALSIAAGQTLVIAAGTTYQGGINGLPSGAQICVAATATFAPPYMNNAQGAVFSRGTITFPGLAVGSGFRIENTGTITFVSNVNMNGAATINNAVGATMTFNQSMSLNNSSTFTNSGQATFAADFGTDNGASFDNQGTVNISGGFRPNGAVHNAGRITVAGSFTTNSAAQVRNECSIVVAGPFTNNANIDTSGTIVTGSSAFVNQGRLGLDITGAITGGDFTNNSQVVGSGRMFFTGATLNQGPMAGTSTTNPIIFFDTTPTSGGIFDVNNSTATNVIRQSFTPPDASTVSPGCVGAGADVTTTKTGPASVIAGASFSYTVSVLNRGPQAAADIVVTDALPAGVTVGSAGGGTVGAGTVTWNVSALAAGGMQSFVVSATADPGTTGPLLNVVSSTATTSDPDPSNNDGSAASAQVITAVTPAPPPNRPPTAVSQERSTTVTVGIVGLLQATDPDVGQTLVWDAIVTAPTNGVATLDPAGRYTYQPAVGFTGIDFFVARTCDNGVPVAYATAQVTISVRPHPFPDSATTTRDVPVVIAVTLNDLGPATPPTILQPPLHGAVVVNPDLTLTYTPAAGFGGIDVFTYQVSAPSAPTVCDGTTVTVSVIDPPNRPPVVGDAVVATSVDVAVTFDVPTSDPDVGQVVSLTATPVSGPANGSALIGATGIVTYTPNANFAGTDVFVVEGCDDGPTPLCSTGVVTITVSPVAGTDVAVTTVDTPTTVAVTSNDHGTTGAPTIVVPSPNGASAIVNPDDTITYTPGAGFIGRDVVVYQVCTLNAPGVCDTADLVVFVAPPPNSPPEVSSEDRTIRANATVSLTLVATDPDLDDATFTTAPVAGPSHGAATITATGVFTYAPDFNFTGLDTVVVEACDPSAACGQGVVTITVTPIARDVTVSTFAGVPVVADVVFNDTGDATPPEIVVAPLSGVAEVLLDRTILYTPASNEVGLDRLVYRVCSPTLPTACDTATLTIYISPLAVDDIAITHAEQSVTILASANDLGDANLIGIAQPPAFGTVTNAGGGVFVYSPLGGFTGLDTFSYDRCDAVSRLCTNATVTIAVLPDAFDDNATTTEDVAVEIFVLANDAGAFAAPVVADTPGHGTATVVGTSIVYSPSAGFVGEDVFTYSSCAPLRRSFCRTASVFVNVLPAPNQPPLLTGSNVATTQGTAVVGTVQATDPEGQPVTFLATPVAGPAYGTASIASNGSFTYQPLPDFIGTDSFTVQACDSLAACATGVVTIEVTAALPPPAPSPPPTPAPPSPPSTIVPPPTTADVSPPPSTGVLPTTGAGTGGPLTAAVIAVLIGVAFVVVARRPRAS